MAQLITHSRSVEDAVTILKAAQQVVDEVRPPASLVHPCYIAAVKLLAGEVLLAPDAPATPVDGLALPGMPRRLS